MQGVTSIAKNYPLSCKYVNDWIAKHAKPGFTWTAFAINRDAKSLLHADSRNLRGTDNFAVSFGDFSGGLLWIESTQGKEPRTQTKANGQVLNGAAHDNKNKPLYFPPHAHHCVLPWKGSRYGLIAFTSAQIGKMDSTTAEILRQLHFRLPSPAAVAAPARLPSRPTACNQGGLCLDDWWTVKTQPIPHKWVEFITLITTIRDEGGASLCSDFSVVCTSLSHGDVGPTIRCVMNAVEIAHLFEMKLFILILDCNDHMVFGGLRACCIKRDNDLLICAGLQNSTNCELSDDFALGTHDLASSHFRSLMSLQRSAKDC